MIVKRSGSRTVLADGQLSMSASGNGESPDWQQVTLSVQLPHTPAGDPRWIMASMDRAEMQRVAVALAGWLTRGSQGLAAYRREDRTSAEMLRALADMLDA